MSAMRTKYTASPVRMATRSCVRLESAERKGVVGSDEDDGRRRRGRELLQDAEAVAFGHLHVEEEERGLQLSHLRQRLVCVAGFADHCHFGKGHQERPDPLARERLVVRDDGADHLFPSRGILTTTSVPDSGFPFSPMAPRVT